MKLKLTCRFHDSRRASYVTPQRRVPLCKDCSDTFWKTMDEARLGETRRKTYVRQPVTYPTPEVVECLHRPGREIKARSDGRLPLAETANLAAELAGTSKVAVVKFDNEYDALRFRRIIYRYQDQRGVKFKTSIDRTVVCVGAEKVYASTVETV